MRGIGAVLPTAGLSASLIFGAVAWNAHHRAQQSGETGFAALFGVRESFDPLDFNPKPLRRESPAPVMAQQASPIELPAIETAPRYSQISTNAANLLSPAPAADQRPTVTVYLAPWSTFCHDAVVQIQHLRDELALRGVATRIVIGLDSQDHLDAFAAEVGGDILFEPGPQTSNPTKGVPAFVAADASRLKAVRVGAFDLDGDAAAWALGRLGR